MNNSSIEKDDLKGWEEKRDSLVSEVFFANQNIISLNTEIKNLKEIHSNLKKEVEEIEKNRVDKQLLSADIARIRNEISGLEVNKKRLENQILESEKSLGIDGLSTKKEKILKEISVLEDISNNLSIKNRDLSESNTDIQNRIIESKGRLNELERSENARSFLISKEISNLEIKKTELENKLFTLNIEVKQFEDKKTSLLRDLANVTALHDHIYDKALGLENIVASNLGISNDNSKKFIELLNTAAVSLQKVIDIGDKNVEKTNKVIAEIPKMIVEIHRGIIERRKINKVRTPKIQ